MQEPKKIRLTAEKLIEQENAKIKKAKKRIDELAEKKGLTEKQKTKQTERLAALIAAIGDCLTEGGDATALKDEKRGVVSDIEDTESELGSNARAQVKALAEIESSKAAIEAATLDIIHAQYEDLRREYEATAAPFADVLKRLNAFSSELMDRGVRQSFIVAHQCVTGSIYPACIPRLWDVAETATDSFRNMREPDAYHWNVLLERQAADAARIAKDAAGLAALSIRVAEEHRADRLAAGQPNYSAGEKETRPEVIAALMKKAQEERDA